MALGSDIVDEVRAQLNDEDTSNFRWADAEMLRYVNASQRRIVTLKPEANIVEEQTTVTGGTEVRQELPAGGIKFVKVAANYDTVASRRGPAITRVEMDAMDSIFPEWTYSQATLPNVPNIEDQYTDVAFEHYMHDPREPTVFYLYPFPPVGSFDVMLVYSKIPTALVALSGTYALSDEYLEAAIEYVTYRALLKDGRFSVSPTRRLEWYNNFLRELGLQEEAEANVSPENPAMAAPGGP